MDTYSDKLVDQLIESINNYEKEWKGITLLNALRKIQIILLVQEYCNLCNKSVFWEVGEFEARKNVHAELNKKKKEINKLLKELIPKDATKKKAKPIIQVVRKFPEAFVFAVESKKKQIEVLLKKYKDKYKRKARSYHIKEMLRNEFNIDDNEIKLTDNSAATIAISIIAYYSNVGFSSLYKIYTGVGDKGRKEIIS